MNADVLCEVLEFGNVGQPVMKPFKGEPKPCRATARWEWSISELAQQLMGDGIERKGGGGIVRPSLEP